MLKRNLFVAVGLSAAICLAAGCGGGDEGGYEEELDETVVESKIEQALKKAEGGGGGAGDDLAAVAAGAPPPSESQESTEPPPPAVSLEPMEVDGGLETDLDILNQAVEAYYDRSTRGIDDKIEAVMEQMDIRTEQEEAVVREKLEQRYAIPPMETLEDLVKARIVARIPDAPEGKKYVFNKESGQVEMVDAKAP